MATRVGGALPGRQRASLISNSAPDSLGIVASVVVAERYRVLEPLAQGGMGEVYRAEHVETGRIVALKVIRELGDGPEDREVWLERFRREARVIGKLDTPHVVQVLDAGRDTERELPFIAMELLSGQDLKELLGEKGTLEPHLALRLVGQACRGLASAHAAGVVHRDIKPGNIFVARRADGSLVVKVLDFGIAKVTEDTVGEDLTKTGNHLGTPRYMSPEQAQGLKNVDARTDVWALGIVLYRCLAGGTPFDDISAPGQLIVAISTRDAPSLLARAPNVSDALHRLVHKALSRRPRDRFADAQEMLAAIEAIVGSDLTVHPHDLAAAEPTPAPEREAVTVIEPLLAPAESSIAASSAPAPVPKVSSKRRQFLGFAGVAAALGLIAIVAIPRTFSPEAPAAAGSASVSPVAAIAPRASSLPSPVAPPTTSSQAAKTMSASVSVMPKAARVRVDGEPAELKDGRLELRGEIGSVKTVSLTHQGQEQVYRVVLSAAGPIPEQLTWATRTTTTRPAPTRPSMGAPAAAPKPTPAPAPKPGLPPATDWK
ncbi:MAG: protein kinase [Polyangiaceae bacterium]